MCSTERAVFEGNVLTMQSLGARRINWQTMPTHPTGALNGTSNQEYYEARYKNQFA